MVAFENVADEIYPSEVMIINDDDGGRGTTARSGRISEPFDCAKNVLETRQHQMMSEPEKRR